MIRAVYVVFLLSLSLHLAAQGNGDNAVEHMSYLTSQDDALSRKYMSYMSEVAHGGRARKMEKRREELVNSIRETMRECAKVRPYKGDASLRDSYRDYYFVLLSIFNEDYHKIVDMEEVAERSYDAMEAYLLTQEKADEKLDEANEKLKVAYTAFAAKNNVTLVQGTQSKLTRKLVKVGKVNGYMHQVYLIFFKSNVQEMLMIESIEKKDVNAIEQYKNSLLKFSKEGLERLDTVKSYNGDGSLVTACRKVLEFQKNEAETKINNYTDFLMKEVEFTKMKKSFDTKPASSRTKQEVDSFNAAVNSFNSAIANYNKTNSELNNTRNKVMTNWDTTRKRFLDQHVPH
jgi:hypothetical protein